MNIKIPQSTRNKALFIVDVQPQTLEGSAVATLETIRAYVRATSYPLYVIATYYTGPESMLYKQNQWLLPKEQAGSTDENVLKEIRNKNAKFIQITKQVRSCFKSDQQSMLQEHLKSHDISEIHLLGYDINDCVLGTAYDAIDLGYYTYVIEEACDHYAGIPSLKEAAITVLRRQSMTNNSSHFEYEEIDI
jgi:nicotinamidase-related amidase